MFDFEEKQHNSGHNKDINDDPHNSNDDSVGQQGTIVFAVFVVQVRLYWFSDVQ